MKKITNTFALVTLAITVLLTGCNTRSVGDDQSNNANENTNINQNANQSEYLTRHHLYFNTVDEIMGFDSDLGFGCISGYSDIDNHGDYLISEYLCWSLSFLHDLDVDTSSHEPGLFLPDHPVNRAEMWKALTNMIGFMPYQAQCSLIAGEDEWFNYYLGALCDKGLLAEYEPAELVTYEEWYDTLSILRQFMQSQAVRVHAAEALIQLFVGSPTLYDTECTSQFPDILNDTSDCLISNRAVDLGLMEGYPNGTFDPNGHLNWAELFKITVLATYVDPDETGCYEEECSVQGA